MSAETNKAIVRRYHEEVWNNRRLNLLDEFIAEEFGDVDEQQVPGHSSRDVLRASIGSALAAFADFHITLDDVIAEGNMVVTRSTFAATHQGELMGIPRPADNSTCPAQPSFAWTMTRLPGSAASTTTWA